MQRHAPNFKRILAAPRADYVVAIERLRRKEGAFAAASEQATWLRATCKGRRLLAQHLRWALPRPPDAGLRELRERWPKAAECTNHVARSTFQDNV